MCTCAPSDEERLNKTINELIKKDKAVFDSTFKVLLLGAGESGKSTFLKQVKIIHAGGFSESERKGFKSTIQSNIVLNCTRLLEAAKILNNVPPLAVDNQALAVMFESTSETATFHELAQKIKVLWKDPAIQHCLKRTNEFQLFDNAVYFFEEIDRIAEAGYIPSIDDVLKVRAKTTGIIENSVQIEANRWDFVDVGGQRSERRKWIHCFDEVTAVIFFVSLAEYDQKCAEDNLTNRMSESMRLFKDISNYKAFADKTALILFLNKKDIFQQKIKEVPLNVFFKNYTGGKDPKAGATHIRKEFLKMGPPGKEIHVYKTCATDTNNIRLIFRAVREHILTNSFIGMGFESAEISASPKAERKKKPQEEEELED